MHKNRTRRHKWARYYDANIGKWTSQDPIGFEAGDSNVYRYINNQPLTNTDPSGKLVFADSEQQAVAFVQQLRDFGAKNVFLKKIDGSHWYYIHTEPSDRKYLFEYADSADSAFAKEWSRLKALGAIDFTDPDRVQPQINARGFVANRRNEFLFATGAVGEKLAKKHHILLSCGGDVFPIPHDSVKKVLNAALGHRGNPKDVSLEVDLGGEGRHNKLDSNHFVYNSNIWTKGNFPYFVWADNASLPFVSKSVSRFYLDIPFGLQKKWIDQMVEDIEPGGRMYFFLSGDGFRDKDDQSSMVKKWLEPKLKLRQIKDLNKIPDAHAKKYYTELSKTENYHLYIADVPK